MKLGTEVLRRKNGIILRRKTNEVEIILRYEDGDERSVISIQGNGDLGHHLIEETHILIKRLAEEKEMKL